MKYYLENIKRYFVYIYLLIRNRKPHSIAVKLFSKISKENQLLYSYENSLLKEKGSFVLINNKWGEYKLKKDEVYFQEMFISNDKYLWFFKTQNKNRGVIGFPEIFIGKTPFGGESTSLQLPKRIKDINVLNACYDVLMYIEPKKYNLVFDLWVTKNGKSETKDISHEIMIWEDRNVATPAGKFIKIVKTRFGNYKMYHTWMDRSSEKLGVDGWFFTAFVRQDRRRSGTVDLLHFIYLMVVSELLSEYDLISTVEFGNEVYNSCGYTVVNDYKLEIK